MRISQQRSLPLFALALIGMVAYGGIVSVHLRYGTLRDGHIIETLAWYGLAFAAYVVAIVWVERSGRFSLAVGLGGGCSVSSYASFYSTYLIG